MNNSVKRLWIPTGRDHLPTSVEGFIQANNRKPGCVSKVWLFAFSNNQNCCYCFQTVKAAILMLPVPLDWFHSAIFTHRSWLLSLVSHRQIQKSAHFYFWCVPWQPPRTLELYSISPDYFWTTFLLTTLQWRRRCFWQPDSNRYWECYCWIF